jgi:hypothetical protein
VGGVKKHQKAFDYSRALQNEAEYEATRRFVLAIKAEVETVWTSYQAEVGYLVEQLQSGEGLEVTCKLRQQYFTVYNSNAQFLGHVEDDELRAAIVRTYTFAKGLIDSHLINNNLLQQYRAISGLNVSSYSSIIQQNQQNTIRQRKAFGSEVKKAYQQTKESIGVLLELMRRSELLGKK